MGDKNIPNVKIILKALATSLSIKLTIDNINPIPKANKMIIAITKGINIASQDGVKPYHTITIKTGKSLIRKSKIACPMVEITSDSFGKLIFVTKEPAFTKLDVLPIRQAENNCQREILHSACKTYGNCVAPISKILCLERYVKRATVTICGNNAQIYPKID